MGAWTIYQPHRPGRYHYRESPIGPVAVFEIVRVEGKLMIDLPNAWVDFSEFDGEWKFTQR